jgi:hypothetical protein
MELTVWWWSNGYINSFENSTSCGITLFPRVVVESGIISLLVNLKNKEMKLSPLLQRGL